MPGEFPDLSGTDWQATRDSMKRYSQVVGKVRRALAARERHWWHVALRVGVAGATTAPIPAGPDCVELLLDFQRHCLRIADNRGGSVEQALHGQSAAALWDSVSAALAGLGVQTRIERSQFDDTPLVYDKASAQRLWRAFLRAHLVLDRFRSGLGQATSPLLLWPHNFDLAFLWFSGRKVAGYDPEDEEHADEQMNFGFEPGDAGIEEPYFYVTAYPMPDGLEHIALPAGAYWQRTGWMGAVLPYAALRATEEPSTYLLQFFQAIHGAGMERMLV
jgi:hypothetical protein